MTRRRELQSTAPSAGAVGGGWGCPHEDQGVCTHVNGLPCDPGMKGCVLFGRFVFSNPDRNISRRLADKVDQLRVPSEKQ
jgi:hypothetical protein